MELFLSCDFSSISIVHWGCIIDQVKLDVQRTFYNTHSIQETYTLKNVTLDFQGSFLTLLDSSWPGDEP